MFGWLVEKVGEIVGEPLQKKESKKNRNGPPAKSQEIEKRGT